MQVSVNVGGWNGITVTLDTEEPGYDGSVAYSMCAQASEWAVESYQQLPDAEPADAEVGDGDTE